VTGQLRHWWTNCPSVPDDETRAIDEMEDGLQPLTDDVLHIRSLIGCFESCHHKAIRHAEIIIAAIRAGRTDKGQGRPNPRSADPREREYDAIIDALSAWCSGQLLRPGARIGSHNASDLVEPLGEQTPLKVWQVQQVVERVRRFRDRRQRWTTAYDALVGEPLGDAADEFRRQTMQCIVHDTEEGRPSQVSLGQAIDWLTGCNWNFIENLRNILRAVGGGLRPLSPLSVHVRNLSLNPACARLRSIADTLQAFGDAPDAGHVDEGVRVALGEVTPVKRWLALSFAKTLSLQLNA